ncbi:MAG: hypothetical protein PHE73_03645 [Sulfurovaceae bacterium]|nr:hypothetical protein [Sulfurovaceae bacterium]
MFKYVTYTPATDQYTTHSFAESNDKCKVHRFDVPLVSVECENESDFNELMASQNPIIQAIEITKEEFASAVSDSAQVQRMYDRANELLKNLMKPISNKYCKEERDTWDSQKEEANAILAGATNTTILGTLATAEGATIQEFAQAVVSNRANFEALSANALVQKRAFLAELKAEVGL